MIDIHGVGDQLIDVGRDQKAQDDGWGEPYLEPEWTRLLGWNFVFASMLCVTAEQAYSQGYADCRYDEGHFCNGRKGYYGPFPRPDMPDPG